MQAHPLAFALTLAALGGCNASRDRTAPGLVDSAVPADDAAPGACDTAHPCPSGQLCESGRCAAAMTCTTDDQCDNDTFCRCATDGGTTDGGPCGAGLCVPWATGGGSAFDPTCENGGFPATDFKAPAVKCQWATPGKDSGVVMTPLVVDLDNDGKPEILFVELANNGASRSLVAMRGDTCQKVFSTPLPAGAKNAAYEQLAVADLDGDGWPEIVMQSSYDKSLLVLDHTGMALARADLPSSRFKWGGAAIANVDGAGPPEISANGSVFRYQAGALTTLWSQPYTGGHWGTMPLFADMDGNGTPELVTGLEVYDGLTGKSKTPTRLAALGANGAPGAYPAVADFNGDGKPDIVVVQSEAGLQQVSVFDYAANKVLFGPYTVGGSGGWGGTPTVGDFDGDGVPDFGLASDKFYYVYALKCAAKAKPVDCTGVDPGVLWQRQIHDLSSGGCGSSTFDFNGDGISEVVYRDECFLRVMDGPTGKTLFARVVSSGTELEEPVIADVDGDGHADLVVATDNIAQGCEGVSEGQLDLTFKDYTAGVLVLTDPLNRWMASRPLWNEHTYHITNINDDLSVPANEASSWSSYNTYRKNVQIGPAALLPDFTAGAPTSIDNGGMDCSATERLWANLCNRGAMIAPAGVPGTFYASDPRVASAEPLCTATTTGPLAPGACEAVHCDRQNPPKDPQDLWFRADDSGSALDVVDECKRGNDVLFLPQFVCGSVG